MFKSLKYFSLGKNVAPSRKTGVILHPYLAVTVTTLQQLLLSVTRWSLWKGSTVFLTIIPRARMDYESIDHEAEGRMGY